MPIGTVVEVDGKLMLQDGSVYYDISLRDSGTKDLQVGERVEYFSPREGNEAAIRKEKVRGVREEFDPSQTRRR